LCDFIFIWDKLLKIKFLRNCSLKEVHKKSIFWIRCLKMKCSRNYPWMHRLVGFKKPEIYYLKWTFSIKKCNGLTFSKLSYVLTLTPIQLKFWHALDHDLEKSCKLFLLWIHWKYIYKYNGQFNTWVLFNILACKLLIEPSLKQIMANVIEKPCQYGDNDLKHYHTLLPPSYTNWKQSHINIRPIFIIASTTKIITFIVLSPKAYQLDDNI
jgi:hypothetical protein